MDGKEVGRNPRAGILLRVSDDRQSGNHSVPVQERECRARCARDGWEVAKVYLGDGETAFTGDLTKRQTMQDILRDAEGGAIDILVVHESSRWARNEALSHTAFDRLEAAGVRWIEAGSEMDYSTPEGRVAFGIGTTLNAYWSRKMSQHIRKGYADLYERGLPTGDIPFGYRNVKSDTGTRGVPEVVHEEAVAIRKAFIDRALGKGYLAIADEWNLMGLRPRSKQGARMFGESSLQSIIENPFYYGMVTHKGHFKEGAHSPILSHTEFLRAQGTVRRGRSVRRNPNRHAILTGIVSCVACGRGMWLSGKPQRSGSTLWYYQERSHLRGFTCTHERQSIRADVADDTVARLVRSMVIGQEWLDFINGEHQVAKEHPNAEAQRADIAKQRARWHDMRAQDFCTDEEMRAGLRKIDIKLAAIPTGTESAAVMFRQFVNVAELWDGLTNEERAEFCRMVFETVVVDAIEKTVTEVVPRADFEPLFAMRATFCGRLSTPARTRGLPHAFAISDLLSAA